MPYTIEPTSPLGRVVSQANAQYIYDTRGEALTVIASARSYLSDPAEIAAMNTAYSVVLREWNQADRILSANKRTARANLVERRTRHWAN